MRRRRLIAGLLLALACTPAEAAPLDEIAAGLRAEGFEVRDVSRTWLGRIRIEAVNDRYEREIVFDRVTGEILRDYLSKRRPERPASDGRSAPGGSAGSTGSTTSGGGRGGGGSSADDDGDDDHGGGRGGDNDGDDNDDDDHGGGNSGSGSSGSNSGSNGGSSGSNGESSGGGDDDDDDD